MSLSDDALKLGELDRRVEQALLERSPTDLATALTEYQLLRKRLKTQLLDQPVASVDDAEVAEIIRKISSGDGLKSDKLVERLSADSKGRGSIAEFSDDEVWDLGSDLFYSWFSHHEYLEGLAELRPLVMRGATSEAVSRLLRQVRDCYAFQQYDAAYGLCRTVIEASIRDICARRQLFPELGENVILFEKFNWSQLRDRVASGELRNRLNALYGDLCSVLHARRTVARDEARRAYEQTLTVVEDLYASHEL